MKSPSHLYRRNGTFYFRWALTPPCRARLAPCPADVRLSLATHRRAVALQRAATLWLHALELASRIIAGGPPFSYNSLLHELRGKLDVTDATEADAGKASPNKVALASLLGTSAIKELQEAVGLLYARGVPLAIPVRCAADVYIQEAVDDQETVDRLSERVHNFVAEVRLTSDHIAEVLSADSYKFHIKEFYWHANPADDARPQDGQLIVPDEPIPCMLLDITTTTKALDYLKAAPPRAALAAPVQAAPPSLAPLFQTTLSRGLEEWLLANPDWVPSTKEAAGSAVRHLVQIVGDKPPEEVTPLELAEFAAFHQKLPSDYFSRRQKYQGMSIKQVIANTEKSGVATFSRSTAANKAEWVSRFFAYLESKGYVVKNVAGGLAPSTKKQDGKEARHPFSNDDIQRIFGQAGIDLISKYIDREKKQIAIWGPLIGLFTGARAQEIALLTVENVYTYIDGTEVIAITDQNSNQSGAARLKTSASKRLVPVHPTLIELGFMSFVSARRRQSSNALLFPEVENYAVVHKRHTAMTKWFNDVLLKKLAVKTAKKSFHSLRHSVIQKFFEDGTKAYKAHQFTGHELFLPAGTKASTQVNTYGRQFEPNELAELLTLLDYEVDWSITKDLTKSLGYKA
ncbi:hypothetical protein [Stenotrophomonas sp. JAG2]|uniref:hypothetical protein n=1 Tax=Stenotrophomonas sp. JAG2 TaxID=3229243 RepID=UPI0034E1CF26